MSTFSPSTLSVDETACHRTFFYVGGRYVDDGKGHGEQILVGQMYVEQLTPILGITKPYPIILVHGAGQTGTNWLSTPDGRQGWCSYLLRLGYRVYIVDLPSRGRSPHHPSLGPLASFPAELASSRWTACSKQVPLLWSHASKHTQWPGSGLPGDPVFDAYYASMVPNPSNPALDQTVAQEAGTRLMDRIQSPVILLTHSQGGIHGWLWADAARQGLIKAIVAIEPSGPPFVHSLTRGTKSKPYGLTDIPLTYEPLQTSPADSQAARGSAKEELSLQEDPQPTGQESLHAFILQKEPARKLLNLSQIPILIVTGEAGAHAAYDAYTAAFLRQAGVITVDHVELADEGIMGNGHLMFLEKNNEEIIALIHRWIADKSGEN